MNDPKTAFSFSLLDEKHLQDIKKQHSAFYSLVTTLRILSSCTIIENKRKGKNGLKQIKDQETYKKLKTGGEIILYKFRFSDKFRCYCCANNELENVLDIIYIDIEHKIEK